MQIRPYGNQYRLVAPNNTFATHELKAGVRRFQLTAGPVTQVLGSSIQLKAWGYDGGTPGPVLVAFEGETVEIEVINRTTQRTSVHWHGLIVPNKMDGVPEIGEGPYIDPGKSFTYRFKLLQSGTYMYHSHVNPLQELMGLVGMFVILPRTTPPVTRDYVLMLQEWGIKKGQSSMGATSGMNMSTSAQGTEPHVYEVDPQAMDFDYFTINGKMFPETSPLRCRYGEVIRIRLGNLSMNSHPMHLHGHVFRVTAADGNSLPAPFFKDTMNVAPGETWDIEFEANNPGNWAFHCHKPHHITDSHQPKLGGMFTYVKYVD